jgi:hypothetical protein
VYDADEEEACAEEKEGVVGGCEEAEGRKNEDGIADSEAPGGGPGDGAGGPAVPTAALPCRLSRARFSIRFRRDSFIK